MAATKKAAAEEKVEPRKPEEINVTLADDNDQTHYDVSQLAARLGGTVVDHGKAKLVVECPLGSDRNPTAARDKLIKGLQTDPQVQEVTA